MSTKELLQSFFPSGKLDIGFEVGDGYVTGVCLLYQSRADQEHEYMIREKSIVAIGNRDISICVQQAKDFAYQSAICRLDGNSGLAFSLPVTQEAPAPGSVLADKEQGDAPTQAENPQGEALKETAAPSAAHPSPVSGESDGGDPAFDDPQEEGGGSGGVSDFENTGEGDDDEGGEPEQGGVQRFDLTGLKPASSLLNSAPPAQPAPAQAVDPEMQKVLAMPITILGKYHESFGKTAGEILETDPQCIVDFAHRYTGPKVEEKEALVMLYSEAMRRVQAAA